MLRGEVRGANFPPGTGFGKIEEPRYVSGQLAGAMTESAGERVAFRTCPLCEAGCGLEITLQPTPDGSGETVKRKGAKGRKSSTDRNQRLSLRRFWLSRFACFQLRLLPRPESPGVFRGS